MKAEQLNEIIKTCCDCFDLSVKDVLGKSRKQDLVSCRSAIVVVLKDIYGLCDDKIGDAINRTSENANYLYNKPKNRFFVAVLNDIKKELE